MKVDSRKADWIVALFVMVVCLLVIWISGNFDKALAAGVSAGVFVTIIQTKWDESRNDWRLWLILSIFAVIHIIVLFVVQIPQLRISLVSLPFALVDGFAIWGLINWIEKHYPRKQKTV